MDHFDLTRLSPVSERDISVIVNLINLGDVFFIKVCYGACDSTCGEPQLLYQDSRNITFWFRPSKHEKFYQLVLTGFSYYKQVLRSAVRVYNRILFLRRCSKADKYNDTGEVGVRHRHFIQTVSKVLDDIPSEKNYINKKIISLKLVQ